MSSWRRTVTMIVLCGLGAIASRDLYAQDAPVNQAQASKPTPKFQAAARVRAIHVPAAILDIWFSQHANTWSEGKYNFSYGAEFGWRNLVDQYELSLAIDWADLRMKPNFWLEDGEPSTAAKYTEMNLQVLSITFASAWYWDINEWFAPYLGAGIGVGVVMGDIIKYRPRQGSSCRDKLGGDSPEPFRPPECFDANGDPRADQIDLNNPEDDGNFLPVLPMVQAMAGARFTIKDYGVLKFELGLHDYLYAGTSFGVQW